MFKRKPKPFYQSKTVQGSLASLVGLLIVISTNLFAIADRNIDNPDRRADVDNIEIIVSEVLKNLPAILGLLGTAWALKGRFSASQPLYTPRGLPGPNQSDLKDNVDHAD